MSDDRKFVYGFVPRVERGTLPGGTPRSRPTLGLAELVATYGRAEMICTAEVFNEFRDDLAQLGIELHEIERVPYSDPEPVL